MDPTQDKNNRRRRRKKKKIDEESIDSVSTISKIVEAGDDLKQISEENIANQTSKNENPIENAVSEKTKKRKKKTRNIPENSEADKKEENIVDENESGQQKPKTRRRKKKSNDSVSSSEEDGREKQPRYKKKEKRRATDSQTLLKEDFYSDPQLATTLQGLEDDLYSINGDGETPTLSPYPLLPTIPSSQPVAKIYLEKQGGFSKASVAAAPSAQSLSSERSSTLIQRSPLELGMMTQKMFRSFCIFCHGLLAGLAAWQVFTIYILHDDDLEFIALYSPLSQPLQIIFYLLVTICTVSVCDRYDIAQFSLTHLQKLVTFRSGGVAILIYWATLLLTLVATKVEDKLSLYQHNSSLFESMDSDDLSYQLESWKILSLVRSLAVVIGWLVISLRPSTDLLQKNLKKMNSSEKLKNSRIETVRMP